MWGNNRKKSANVTTRTIRQAATRTKRTTQIRHSGAKDYPRTRNG